jgi:hypothetical protein
MGTPLENLMFFGFVFGMPLGLYFGAAYIDRQVGRQGLGAAPPAISQPAPEQRPLIRLNCQSLKDSTTTYVCSQIPAP